MPALGRALNALAGVGFGRRPFYYSFKRMTPSDTLEITSLFSFSSLRISLCRRDQTGAPIERTHCTGFLWKRGDELYLITNWHCVTGWDPLAWKAIDEKKCFTPETVTTQVTLSGAVEEEARLAKKCSILFARR